MKGAFKVKVNAYVPKEPVVVALFSRCYNFRGNLRNGYFAKYKCVFFSLSILPNIQKWGKLYDHRIKAIRTNSLIAN